VQKIHIKYNHILILNYDFSNFYKANTRGTAVWLSNHFLSFGNYFNPERVQFGMLRVLNDDTIAAGLDFGTRYNMEIITIPLEGGLISKDSMGNEGVIRWQYRVMSAGKRS
jgi:redox-sensitive bicupin YhaK (pirin superfamily)